MIYRIFSCVIKHHGSLKYFKYVISTSRQNGFKPKAPEAKVFASPSTLSTTSVIENSNRVKNVIEGNERILSKRCNLNEQAPSATENLSVENSASRTSATENFSVENLPSNTNSILKPVVNPDIIVSTSLHKDKDDCKTSNSKPVKLLNTVKPSELEWHKEVLDIRLLPNYYKSLSKFRLTGLVVLTTLAGYGMAPGTFDPHVLLYLILGTGFTSAAANAINQVLEVPYDSQMARTKNRVLIRGLLTPLHAFTFATCCAVVGLSTLYIGTSTLTTALAATNLLLYTSVYTPLKRCSIINTWLGSVVGAIPPLMGWAACTGTLSSSSLLMGAILYSWQFPHFNALSWNLRPDYSKAGYRMTSVVNPSLCRRSALRHSIAMLVFCSSAPLLDLTMWNFAFDSLPLNGYLIYCSWQFYKKGDSKSSRKLFRLSLIHLPALMLLMFLGKKYTASDKKRKLDL